MDITPYAESLRRDLTTAAAAGSPEIAEAAERLLLALEPATRLAMMEAVSQAAAEITSELPAGSVEVRLQGRELDFVVQHAVPEAPAPPQPPARVEGEEEGGLTRITLRLPETIKARAEERAGEAGQSLNTWLVQAVRTATHDAAISVDVDLSSLPFPGGSPFGRRGNRRMTGWI